MYEIYKRILDEKGLKNSDVSRGTGISNMTLSDWKRGKSTPKYENMKKIADFLDVSVEYLMTGRGPEVDYLYTDENFSLLIEITEKIKSDKDFAERIAQYMRLSDEGKKYADNSIDLMYHKEHEGED